MKSIVRALVPGLLSVFCFAQMAVADDLLSQNDFREALISRLQTQSDTPVCAHDLADGGFRAGPSADNCEYYAYVDTTYASYVVAPDRLDEILDNEATRLLQVIEGGVDETGFEDRLVVQLRPNSFLTTTSGEHDDAMVTRRFTQDLVAVLMLDSAETISVVDEDQLVEFGLTEDDAFDLAIANTRDRMGNVNVNTYKTLEVLSSDNGLITGELWLPETCNAQSRDAVYFVYDYNGVLKADRNNVIGISNLLSMARGMVNQGKSATDSVVSCSSGKWSQLWPAPQAALETSPNTAPG